MFKTEPQRSQLSSIDNSSIDNRSLPVKRLGLKSVVSKLNKRNKIRTDFNYSEL